MDVLREGLQKVGKDISHDDDKTIHWQLFTDFYNDLKHGKSFSNAPTFQAIPKFHNHAQDELRCEESLLSKLQVEARSMFLQRVGDALLDTDGLESLRSLLDEYSFLGNIGERLISYNCLKEVISKSGLTGRCYYSAKLFAQLQNGDLMNGASIVSLFTYAMKKTWLKKTRISLSLYDTLGKGHLTEPDLQSFILDLIPDCPQLAGLKKNFYPFYIRTVVEKFMFFLDPMRTGKVRLKDILASNFLDDLLVLRNEDLPEDLQEANWFSAPSTLRVYGQYLNLDKNKNGMLSQSELAGFGTGTLTEIFVKRVFQECLTYEGEMDYKSYLEFVLALENKEEPQALRYYFKILDIDGKGYLDAFTLNYFFRSVQAEMKKHGQDPVRFEDIEDELFDMVRPSDPTRITFKDLLNCDQAGYFVSILTDLNEFWNYENREYT